ADLGDLCCTGGASESSGEIGVGIVGPDGQAAGTQNDIAAGCTSAGERSDGRGETVDVKDRRAIGGEAQARASQGQAARCNLEGADLKTGRAGVRMGAAHGESSG